MEIRLPPYPYTTIERTLKYRLLLIGLHYYSGTQKKNAGVIEKDIRKFEEFIERLEAECGYVPKHVEYGPGAAADYFVPPYEEKDNETLKETAELLKSFSKKYPARGKRRSASRCHGSSRDWAIPDEITR